MSQGACACADGSIDPERWRAATVDGISEGAPSNLRRPIIREDASYDAGQLAPVIDWGPAEGILDRRVSGDELIDSRFAEFEAHIDL